MDKIHARDSSQPILQVPIEEKIDSLSSVLFNLIKNDPDAKEIIEKCIVDSRHGGTDFYDELKNLFYKEGIYLSSYDYLDKKRILQYALITVMYGSDREG